MIDQELEIGSKSIAVPILNISQRTVAAVNVAVHATSANDERLHGEILTQLRDAQTQLAAILP
jgi:IclR family pca regulon transcriptional regulator